MNGHDWRDSSLDYWCPSPKYVLGLANVGALCRPSSSSLSSLGAGMSADEVLLLHLLPFLCND